MTNEGKICNLHSLLSVLMSLRRREKIHFSGDFNVNLLDSDLKVGQPLFNTLYGNIPEKKSSKPLKNNSDSAKANQIHRRN